MAGVLAGITTVMTGMCAKLFVGRSINIFYRKGIFFDAVKSTATSSCTTSDKTARMTGLSKQYLSIKNKYPEFIVLFQVGDFYEIYSGDAVKVAEKTSLRISRNPNVNKLMAGFPVRSLDSWLSTLVQQGFQLAICPQFPEKTPSTSKLLHREVVRLVTPGTLLDPLKPDANYLMSIACGPDCSLGLAWLDLSTGEFHHGLSLLENLEEDLSRINPAEILMAEEHLTSLGTKHNHKTGINIKKSSLENLRDYHLTIVPSDWFTVDSSHQDGALARLLKSVNFSQFSSLEMAAGYSLLKFVSYTQRDIAPLLNQPSKFSLQTHMAIDSNTRRALELTKSLVGTDSKATLFGVMNNTATASGQRLLYSRLCAPSNDVDVVQKRLNIVDFFCMNRHLAEDIQKALKSCPDVERKMQKVATGAASLSDLHAIYSAIALYKYILLLLHDTYFNVNLQAIEELLMKDFSLLDDLYRELDTAVGKVESDHTVMKGYSNKADEIKEKLCKNMKQVDKLRDVYRVSLKIPRLTISNHKSFIRVVEIPLSQKNSLGWNQDFVFLESTKDKARYITLKLQELNAKWKALQEENEIIQRALSDDLCNQVTSHAESLKKLAVALAELDVSSSLAVLAVKRGYVKPIIGNQNEFLVKGGRHPVVDMLQPNSFVCNDCDLGKKNLWIITGPNMGGKSTFLRQNALIAILAQAGSFVPAQTAKIGVIDRLFARIGATDNLVQHQSTFMSEMLETAFILAQATEKSLVVVDEIGRGTSVLDGVSIAWAVIEHLHSSIRCRTLASTHYHQLGKLAHILPHVDCYHVTALHSKDRLSFTYKVNHGCDQKSFGIDVAKLAGVPITVEARAREILQVLEDKGNSLEVTLEEDKLVSESWKTQKGKESSNTSPFITTNDLQAENEITRVLLELNPELLTPKDALEIIYDLHLKAQCKSSRKNY